MHRAMTGLACLATIFLATASANAQSTVKIGVIMSYSGQFADTGTQISNGMKLYMKEHGDTVAGKKVELMPKDNGGIAPDVAKRLAQEAIVRDKVDMIVGFDLTPNALAAADVSAQAKKFMVNMNAATSIITTKSPYMVRTSFTVPQVNESLGTWAYKSGARKAYTLVSDFSPGHDGEQAFQRAFKEAGGEIIGSARYPVANLDFTAFLQRAKDMSPDVIYIWVPGGPQPAAIGKAVAERGIDLNKTKVVGQGELTFDEALKGMGDAGLGFITAFHYDHNHQSAKNKKFVADYNAEFKRNPDMFSVGGYDGMHVIYEALKKTKGDTDGDALIAAAKGMAWESPRGPMSIDPETRDVVQNIYIRRVEKVGGQLLNVEFDKLDNVKDPFKARMPKQ
ncbi:MAG: ABC transporter substrate-binding protein [Alphaproteobacteria bacterium]|nr:ABC transporter substrate-binding protein [Alphaproteobacteria bacterium]